MKNIKTISIKCETKDYLDWHNITEFQGGLKIRDEADIEKAKTSITAKMADGKAATSSTPPAKSQNTAMSMPEPTANAGKSSAQQLPNGAQNLQSPQRPHNFARLRSNGNASWKARSRRAPRSNTTKFYISICCRSLEICC